MARVRRPYVIPESARCVLFRTAMVEPAAHQASGDLTERHPKARIAFESVLVGMKGRQKFRVHYDREALHGRAGARRGWIMHRCRPRANG